MQHRFDIQNHLHVEVNTKNCEVTPDERARMQDTLPPIGYATAEFPDPRLWINIVYHPNSKIYHAEAKLRLPGGSVFGGAHDTYLDSAYQSCVRRLLANLEAAKARPDGQVVRRAERRQALDDNVVMPEDPDSGPVARAVDDGDYRAFRRAMVGYEDWLRKRVGRWIQRYPEVEARVDDEPLIGDLVEEVYLTAFENFTRRNTDLRLSEWLDGLIDSALQEYLRHPAVVHEEASLARTVRAAAIE
jgi:hypothetical protein